MREMARKTMKPVSWTSVVLRTGRAPSDSGRVSGWSARNTGRVNHDWAQKDWVGERLHLGCALEIKTE